MTRVNVNEKVDTEDLANNESGYLVPRRELIKKLLNTNVNEHTEKKQNLTYLSWAWAWAEALKADSAATYKVEMFEGKPFVDINGTAMVFVTVTMFGKPMTCQLPVMDFRNKAIPKPDAFAVNTAIMRCMTKALSLHGLGLYIYAGEDLPEDAPRISPTKGVVVSEDRTSLLTDVAIAVQDRFESDDIIGAWDEFSGITDGEEKTYVWGQLPSNVRSALKKHNESLKGK
jgi:hypothetical protein